MKFIAVLVLPFIFVSPSFADQEVQPPQEVQEPEQPRDYLPGEEVITPSGKKLKVWSTRGAVPVSKAPEPFKDDSLQGDLDVVIDGRPTEREEIQRPYRQDNR